MANPNNYQRPTSLDDALRLLAQPDTIPLAGGALTLNTLDIPHPIVVDLQGLADLANSTAVEGGYALGGMVTLGQVVELPELHPVIRQAISRCIPLNTRNQLTVMESLSHLDHPMLAEWLSVLAALDCTTHWISARRERRTFTISELLAHHEEGSEPPGVLLQLNLTIPQMTAQALGLSEIARTPADEPIVCAAVFIRLDAELTPDIASAAISGVSSVPITLVNLPVDPAEPFKLAHLPTLAASIQDQIDPISDWRASADYRRAMATVCVQRALEACAQQLP